MDHVVRQGIDERIVAPPSLSGLFLTPGIDVDDINRS